MPANDSEVVHIKFFGTRGSVPTPGQDTVRYGGNTCCVEVTWGENHRLIFDAGTGIRILGERLSLNGTPPGRIDIAFSHLHWDHIQGLPFFIPMYINGVDIHLWGGGGKGVTLDLMMDHQLHSSFFPVGRASLSANLLFHLITPGHYEVSGGTLSVCATNHPGGCFAYRLDAVGKSIVYATDRESDHGGDSDSKAKESALIEMAKGADLLIHDAQYTEDEYNKYRRGWGHSSFSDALRVARAADISRLILFHHDPTHTDAFLESIEEHLKVETSDIDELMMAFEGQIVLV